MKAGILSIVLLFSIAGYAQNTLNGYKYVIVPVQFSFAKSINQYGANTVVKQLLVQKGFVVIWDNDDLPPAIAANACSALRADVQENNGMFATKLTLLLKDCQGRVLFQSKEGKSRDKDYLVAYAEALKDAFSTLNALPYTYDSTLTAQPQQAAPATAVASPVVSNPATLAPAMPVSAAGGTSTLYAQATANGYQLVDTTPKKIFTLLKTSVQDYFIAQAETYNGIVFKRNGEWFFEYYKDDKLISRKLEIKF